MTMARFCAVITMAAPLLVLACGGDDGAGLGTSGTITVTSTVIANQSGKVLVVSAQPDGQSTYVGRACVPITSNSFAVPATVVVEPAPGGNPCDPAVTTKIFAPGRFTLTASVFTPGSQAAEKTTTTSVKVSGNVIASLNGAALSN